MNEVDHPIFQPTMIPWILVFLSLAGNVLVIHKKRSGFLLWSVGNVAWVILKIEARAYAEMTLFGIYLILSVYGFLSWKERVSGS